MVLYALRCCRLRTDQTMQLGPLCFSLCFSTTALPLKAEEATTAKRGPRPERQEEEEQGVCSYPSQASATWLFQKLWKLVPQQCSPWGFDQHSDALSVTPHGGVQALCLSSPKHNDAPPARALVWEDWAGICFFPGQGKVPSTATDLGAISLI